MIVSPFTPYNVPLRHSREIMISEVIFDLETKSFFDDTGTFDPAALGVSIVSVYSRTLDANFKEIEGKMESFWEKDFERMWPLFEGADRLIGFNSKRFDAPALKPYTATDLSKLPHFDILEEIRKVHGKRASLNRVAKATLNKGKNDDAKNAIVYWEKGDEESLNKLKMYCEQDVTITKEVYDFARVNGFLSFTNYWNSPFTIKVDFSYPTDFIPKSKQASQASLF